MSSPILNGSISNAFTVGKVWNGTNISPFHLKIGESCERELLATAKKTSSPMTKCCHLRAKGTLRIWKLRNLERGRQRNRMNKKIVKLPKQNNPSAVRCFLISYHNIHSSGLFSSVTENVRPGTDPKMTRSSRYSTFFFATVQWYWAT